MRLLQHRYRGGFARGLLLVHIMGNVHSFAEIQRKHLGQQCLTSEMPFATDKKPLAATNRQFAVSVLFAHSDDFQPTKRSRRKLSSYQLLQDLMDLASNDVPLTDAAACRHAANILERAHTQYFNKTNTACKPTAAMYTAAINVYGKHGQPQHAQEALEELWGLYNQTQDEEMKPNVKTYTAVIDAWGRRPNGLQKCENLLKNMMRMHQIDPQRYPQPNSITFDAVLNALAHQPSTGNVPERAEAILQQMQDLRLGKYGDVAPDTHSFTSVITCWARSKRPESSERAKHILDRMMQLSRTQPQVKPNTYTFNAVLDAFANSNDAKAADDATKLLEVMLEMSQKPDTITYNTVLKVYSKSKAYDAAQRADRLLEKMRSEYEHNRNLAMKPNDVSFNSVIAAHAHHSTQIESVQRATSLLLEMIDLYKNNPLYRHLQPSVVSFTAVMDAWAKSKVPGKAPKAYSMLVALRELYAGSKNDQKLKPNIFSYNTVLNACAFSAEFAEEHQKKALLVAIRTYNELKKKDLAVQPDMITYGMMLKVCANLMPNDEAQRLAMAQELFTAACKDGVVGSLVLSELKRAVPPKTFKAMIGENIRKLPRAWTRNVRERNATNKKAPKRSVASQEPLKPKQVSRFARTGPVGGESTSIGIDFV